MQNVIRDSGTRRIVFLPPEAQDVPALIAALVHYQFVTIHPYYDGNGRTARLIATFLLHRDGYGLNGFFSLEEHHARDLDGYYQALVPHPHHNYYEGRAEADLTRLGRVLHPAHLAGLRAGQGRGPTQCPRGHPGRAGGAEEARGKAGPATDSNG